MISFYRNMIIITTWFARLPVPCDSYHKRFRPGTVWNCCIIPRTSGVSSQVSASTSGEEFAMVDISGWWWMVAIFLIFPVILGISFIIPLDSYFFRGVALAHQPDICTIFSEVIFIDSTVMKKVARLVASKRKTVKTYVKISRGYPVKINPVKKSSVYRGGQYWSSIYRLCDPILQKNPSRSNHDSWDRNGAVYFFYIGHEIEFVKWSGLWLKPVPKNIITGGPGVFFPANQLCW